MTPEQFARAMREIQATLIRKGNKTVCHERADLLMATILNDVGYADGIETWYQLRKLYHR